MRGYAHRMSTAIASPGYDSVQPIVSHNVRILMAYKRVGQEGIAEVIEKTATSVGHKLNGRAQWTLDEISALSLYGGAQWPIARFFNDPESLEPTHRKVPPKLRSISGEGRETQPQLPMLATAGTV